MDGVETNRMSRSSTVRSLNDMKEMMANLPQFQEMKSKVTDLPIVGDIAFISDPRSLLL